MFPRSCHACNKKWGEKKLYNSIDWLVGLGEMEENTKKKIAKKKRVCEGGGWGGCKNDRLSSESQEIDLSHLIYIRFVTRRLQFNQRLYL